MNTEMCNLHKENVGIDLKLYTNTGTKFGKNRYWATASW